MAINLQKGQTIDLRKSERGDNFDLTKMTIGLGWDVRQKEKGIFGKIFGKNEEEYDLDAIAFLLNDQGKVANLGRKAVIGNREVGLYGGDIVFYNSLKHPSGHIWLTGDNRTGAGEGDDEQIIVKLDSLDQKYSRIVFVVSIYQGQQNNQDFSMVENAFIRAVDAKGEEITKYTLSGDSSLEGICSFVFAEAYRYKQGWKFRAIGEPYRTDNFIDILKEYT